MSKLLFIICILILLTSCANIQPTNDEIINAYYGNKPQNAKFTITKRAEKKLSIGPEFINFVCEEPKKKWVNLYGNIHYGWDVHCIRTTKNITGYHVREINYLFNDETIISDTSDRLSGWSNEGLVD